MAQTVGKLSENLAVTAYAMDTGDTSATDIAWVDMRDFESVIMSFVYAHGTAGVTTFLIHANAESDGSGTDAIMATFDVASSAEPDAASDIVHLECTAEQLAGSTTANLRYVSAVVTAGNNDQDGVVIYVRKPKRAFAGLTSDVVAA